MGVERGVHIWSGAHMEWGERETEECAHNYYGTIMEWGT